MMPTFPNSMEEANKNFDAKLEEFKKKKSKEVREYMDMMDLKVATSMGKMKIFF